MEIVPFHQKPKPPAKTGWEPITAKNYHERALKFAQASGNSEFPTITTDKPEFEAWRRYFDEHLRWRPWAFKALCDGRVKEFTCPAQWPEWFDATFAGSET